MTASPRPIGALRHRLTLERADVRPNDSVVWRAVAVVGAAITPLAAAEADGGAARTGTVTHRLELRWRADLDSRDRLRTGTRIFRIVASHDLDERRRRLVVLAEEERR